VYFAQDPTDLKAAEKFLTDAFVADPELHWIALIDGAFDHGNGAAGTVYKGLNCYAAEYPLNDLVGAAPWLVELDALEQVHKQVTKLLKHCSGRPMLSVLASRIPARALAKRWLPLHQVHTSDKQRLLLRFADTRTLPLLPDILLPAQWAAIAAPLAHWFLVSREGAMVSLPPLPEPTEGGLPTDLRLSQIQLDAMVKACEPDAALDMLAEQMPEIFAPNVAHGKLHGYIKRKTFGLIDRHGIENWTDKVSLVTAELLTNGKLHDDPKLEELLLTKAWQPGNLREALLDHKLV
jgi:hypothetical protein